MVIADEYDIDLFQDFKITQNLKYRWYGENIIIDYRDDNQDLQSVELLMIKKPLCSVRYNDRIYVLPDELGGFVIFDDNRFGVTYNYLDDSKEGDPVYKLLVVKQND